MNKAYVLLKIKRVLSRLLHDHVLPCNAIRRDLIAPKIRTLLSCVHISKTKTKRETKQGEKRGEKRSERQHPPPQVQITLIHDNTNSNIVNQFAPVGGKCCHTPRPSPSHAYVHTA